MVDVNMCSNRNTQMKEVASHIWQANYHNDKLDSLTQPQSGTKHNWTH